MSIGKDMVWYIMEDDNQLQFEIKGESRWQRSKLPDFGDKPCRERNKKPALHAYWDESTQRYSRAPPLRHTRRNHSTPPLPSCSSRALTCLVSLHTWYWCWVNELLDHEHSQQGKVMKLTWGRYYCNRYIYWWRGHVTKKFNSLIGQCGYLIK